MDERNPYAPQEQMPAQPDTQPAPSNQAPAYSQPVYGAPVYTAPPVNNQPPYYAPAYQQVTPVYQQSTPAYQQVAPVYQVVQRPVVAEKRIFRIFGLISFIFGFVGIGGSWIPIFDWFVAVLSIVGIVFGALGMRSYSMKGKAIAGMICSIVALVLCIIFMSYWADELFRTPYYYYY